MSVREGSLYVQWLHYWKEQQHFPTKLFSKCWKWERGGGMQNIGWYMGPGLGRKVGVFTGVACIIDKPRCHINGRNHEIWTQSNAQTQHCCKQPAWAATVDWCSWLAMSTIAFINHISTKSNSQVLTNPTHPRPFTATRLSSNWHRGCEEKYGKKK